MRQLTIEQLQDANVYSADGDKIGSVSQVYVDQHTSEPTFVAVNTGFFGTRVTFMPVEQATATEDGITVPFTKDHVKDAPNVEGDAELTPNEEREIYAYYGLTHGAVDTTEPQANPAEHATHPQATEHVDAPGAAHTDADEVVAHEERLVVGDATRKQATDQLRLRKHVVTDTETVEVPVRREEIHVERTSIDPDSAEAKAAATYDFDEGEKEVSMTAYEERATVDTEVVATEKVSLNKETHRETEQVSGEVRKEEIVVDDDTPRS